MIKFRKLLSEKESAKIKYETVESWLAKGNKITVLPARKKGERNGIEYNE